MEINLKNTRDALNNEACINTYNEIVSICKLTDRENAIIRMKYINGMNLNDIADQLGLSESSIKKAHVKILRKISKVL